MTKVRMLVAVLATLLLTAGYLASQVAYLQGQAAEYAAKVEAQPIVALSLVVFIAALVLFLTPEREEPKP